MDEKDFILLDVLSKTRNISHAAEQLYMSQSSLSKRLRAIEQEVGAELFLRSRQGVRFTPAGEAVLSSCSTAAQSLDQMRKNLNKLQNNNIISGTLKIGTTESYAAFRLPNVLAEYHKQYSSVMVNVVTGRSLQIYRKLTDEEVDVAIIRGQYPWDGMKIMLHEEPLCLIHSREYIGVPLSDYMSIWHRTKESTTSRFNMMKMRWLRENGLDSQNESYCVDSVAACVELVKKGLGWSLITNVGFKDFDGCITPCTFKTGETIGRQLYVLCPRDAVALPQIRAFIDFLLLHG